LKEVDEGEALTFKRSRLHVALPLAVAGLAVWTLLWMTARLLAGVPEEGLFTNYWWGTSIAALMAASAWFIVAPHLKITRWGFWDFDGRRNPRKWTWERVSNIRLCRNAIGLPRITFDTPEGRVILKGPWVGVDPTTVFTALLFAKDAPIADGLGSEGDLSDD
jgi:hypothetical protein